MAYIRKKDGKFMGGDGRIWRHQHYSTALAWSPQMLSDLRRFFPTTLNQELAEIIGVSPRTLIRKARQLGLQKDPAWLIGIWNERRLLAHAASKKAGHPGCFKKGNSVGAEYRFKKKSETLSKQII